VKKPKKRRKFADDADEFDYRLSCLCWRTAKRSARDLGIPHEILADCLKELVLEGHLVLESDSKGERARIVQPSQAKN
jgi:hypothetical protein